MLKGILQYLQEYLNKVRQKGNTQRLSYYLYSVQLLIATYHIHVHLLRYLPMTTRIEVVLTPKQKKKKKMMFT